MKLSVCLLAALAAGVSCAESIHVTPDVAPVGTRLVVTPDFAIPADETFKAWNVCAYCRDVPSAFAARHADKTDTSNGKYWSSFAVRDYTWTKAKPASFELDTAGWPAGDYVLRFQYYAAKGGKDVYPTRDFTFTLTEDRPRADRDADWHGGFKQVETGKDAAVPTKWKYGVDDDYLYFTIVCDEPEAMDEVRALKPIGNQHPLMWKLGGVEVNLDPTGKGESFYKMIVDPPGDLAEYWCVDDNTGTEKYATHEDWRSRAEVRTAFGKTSWSVELKVARGAFDLSKAAEAWGVSVCRSRAVKGRIVESSASYATGKGKFMEGRTFPKHAVPASARQAFEITTPKVKTVSKDGRLSVRAAYSVMNRTGEYRALSARVTIGTNKATFGSAAQDVGLVCGVLKEIEMEIPVDRQGPAQFRVELFSKTGVLLKETRSDVDVAYEPVKIVLDEPCYRDCVFETMKLKAVRGRVIVEEGLGKPLEVKLSGPKTELRQTIAAAKATNAFAFAFADAPKGVYHIQAGEAVKRLRNLPYRKNEVWFDRDGVAYRDGRKFLPFGWFSEQFRTPHKGLTIAQEYSNYYRSTEDVVKRCRRADEHGMGFVGMPFHSFDRKYSYDQLFGIPRMQGEFGLKGEIGDAQKRMVRAFAETAREEPGFFAYYLVDEPEGRGLNPDFFTAVKEYLANIDPYHPTISLNYSKAGVVKYRDCADINCPDAYPMYYKDGRTKDPKRDLFDKARLAFDNGQASGWIVPQAFDWPVKDGDRVPRGPNYDEYREQHMLALAGNTKGFMLYTVTSYAVPSVEQNYSWRYVLDEIGEAWETFLAPSEYPKTVTTPKSAAKSVFAAVKRFGDDLVLIVENVGYDPVEVEIDASTLPKCLYLSDVGATAVNGKTFKLALAASETRVYRLKPWAFSIRKAKEEMAALEAARRKPGNLCVAPKFLTWGEIGNFSHVKVEPYYPRMELSSAYSQYPTKNVRNFSYFLQDGFDASYPYVNFHSWGPRGDDKAPWVKVDFGSKKRFSKVVLCRYKDGKGCYPLKGAAIDVDGREVASFKDDGTAGDKAVLEFPPVEAASFTVRITETDRSGDAYLLTEIEAY